VKHTLVTTLLLTALSLALAPTALASTTWYVNGVTGTDSNNCISATTACKTIGQAISLASSGDSIKVAAATYPENLTIGISLKVVGSGASRTIIDGRAAGIVVTISSGDATVTLSNVTIRNGSAVNGGGINNAGTLTINSSTITDNSAHPIGGGIYNSGALKISNSTLSANSADPQPLQRNRGLGGGIYNGGTATINNSTLSGNSTGGGGSIGGGIGNTGTLTINNSTLSGNSAHSIGGGISNHGTLTVSNSTLSGNFAGVGGGINSYGGTATLQNSIVANSSSGGNCSGTMTSKGYNLSSDGSCNFNGPGDLNNTGPQLGPLQNNGGPTQTMALPSSSPAVDAGNPNGCTDGLGHLLKTDQRGMRRPDTEDTGACDMGAYELQPPPTCIPQGGACFGPGHPNCCPAPRGHHSYCSNPTGWGTCVES
jgi:hypothetical protein